MYSGDFTFFECMFCFCYSSSHIHVCKNVQTNKQTNKQTKQKQKQKPIIYSFEYPYNFKMNPNLKNLNLEKFSFCLFLSFCFVVYFKISTAHRYMHHSNLHNVRTSPCGLVAGILLVYIYLHLPPRYICLLRMHWK